MKYKYNGSIMDERMEVFLEMFSSHPCEYLNEIACKAANEHVPVIRKQTGELLVFLLKAFNVKNVLEIGTATGYSALYMAGGKPDIYIDTIEKVDYRAYEAEENFKNYALDGHINVMFGDALTILPEIISQGKYYDMVFMDAAKGQYHKFAEYAYSLLNPGGILVTDNVMQEGEILESRYAVVRRNRSVHTRMRDYLYDITHSDRWNSIVLPIGDGVVISIKQEKDKVKNDEK